MRTEITKADIGAALKEARTGNGQEQGEIAERLGVKQPYLSRIENGKSELYVTRFHRLCQLLHWSESKIIERAQELADLRAYMERKSASYKSQKGLS